MRKEHVIVLGIFLAFFLVYLFCSQWSPEDILAEWNAMRPEQFLPVPDDEKEACLIWAFGEDYTSVPFSMLTDRWRSLHPELQLMDCTPVEVAFKRIAIAWNTGYAEEWKKQKSDIKFVFGDPVDVMIQYDGSNNDLDITSDYTEGSDLDVTITDPNDPCAIGLDRTHVQDFETGESYYKD